jgi:threonine dehydrogenase-like Zn-dependent dehydrogenase
MKAVVWHDVGDIRLDDVPEPTISDPHDAIVEITASAICGTDLHFVRGSMGGMKEGTILGHEAVGIVREVGPAVRNHRPGHRVVIGSTIGCGACVYCRAGCYSQCDTANPNGKTAGTAFFGGPASTGAFDGFQAQFARVPYAHVGLVHVPDAVSDDQALMISDIFPTGWFGAELAGVHDGDAVAVFGAGPVGLFACLSAQKQGAGRVFAVDSNADRLEAARRMGVEAVDFTADDPVEALREATAGAGPDRIIDAVGVDAESPSDDGTTTKPGQDPTQAARWYVDAVAKAGSIGMYPPDVTSFPLGQAMNKNLVLKMGNTAHRRYLSPLLDLTAAGVVDPATVLTHEVGLASGALDAYEHFARHHRGWVKTSLDPAG